jgi:hypothetical protein
LRRLLGDFRFTTVSRVLGDLGLLQVPADHVGQPMTLDTAAGGRY